LATKSTKSTKEDWLCALGALCGQLLLLPANHASLREESRFASIRRDSRAIKIFAPGKELKGL
jgi:hypothetical protein